MYDEVSKKLLGFHRNQLSLSLSLSVCVCVRCCVTPGGGGRMMGMFGGGVGGVRVTERD